MYRSPNSKGRASTKWQRLVSTATTGRTCGEKIAFVIRLPPELIDAVASRIPLENQIQGRSPAIIKAV